MYNMKYIITQWRQKFYEKKVILLGSFLMAALLALDHGPYARSGRYFSNRLETESAAICLVNVDTGTVGCMKKMPTSAVRRPR